MTLFTYVVSHSFYVYRFSIFEETMQIYMFFLFFPKKNQKNKIFLENGRGLSVGTASCGFFSIEGWMF